MTRHRSVLQEAAQSERGLQRVQVGILMLWLGVLTLLVGIVLYVQHQDSSRANNRLDRLEQTDLPAKSAYRDAQTEKIRRALCTALSHERQTADVMSARRVLLCDNKVTPSSTPAATSGTSGPGSATSSPTARSSSAAAPSLAPSAAPRTATATRTAPGPTVTVRPSPPPTSRAPAPVPVPTTAAPCLLGLVCLHLN